MKILQKCGIFCFRMFRLLGCRDAKFCVFTSICGTPDFVDAKFCVSTVFRTIYRPPNLMDYSECILKYVETTHRFG